MTFRTRIVLVVFLVMGLLVISQLTASYLSQSQVEKRFNEATITGKTVLWRKIIASQLDQMQASAMGDITRDRETLKALTDANVGVLHESVITTYNRLSVSHVLSRLQVTDVNGRVLFSAPVDFSGKTEKVLVHEAIAESRIKRGLQRDDDGTLVAVVAFPLYSRGKLAGVGVFARELDFAIQDFKENDGAHTFIVDNSGRQEYGTDEGLLSDLALALPTLGERTFSIHRVGEQTLSVVVHPVLDAAGQPLAHLISANDYTASFNKQQTIDVLYYTFLALIVGAGLFFLFWHIQRAFKPFDMAVAAVERITSGDLTGTIEVTTRDETGKVLASLKVMNERLQETVSKVREGANIITTSSREIATGSIDLSQRTSEQASSLEETASSMEEFTATVKRNAHNAGKANELANNARDRAQEGNDVVKAAVSAMAEIRNSSGKISEIIRVINEIAFQTNLLALNAAVEAARAGDQGLGFAVVAAEVRSLAQRSASAASEIRGLIGDSVEKVEVGSKQVDVCGEVFNTIAERIREVSDIVSEITLASEEQASGIDQVNTAIVQMDTMTQKNAALVEEAAAASQSMEEQAYALNRTMEFFTTRETSPMPIQPAGTLEVRVGGVSNPADKKSVRMDRQAASSVHAPAKKAVGDVPLANQDDWNEF